MELNEILNEILNDIEIWKPIKDFEMSYEVSSFGRVKSLKFGKEHILKPVKNKYGYLVVELCKNGLRKKYSVHRLVGFAFIPNTENKPDIDHIDTNPTNNNVTNLRWCTQKENNNNPLTKINSQNTNKNKAVLQFTKSGVFLNEFKSIREASRYLNNKYAHNNICSCCKGRYKSAYNFIWKYKE